MIYVTSGHVTSVLWLFRRRLVKGDRHLIGAMQLEDCRSGFSAPTWLASIMRCRSCKAIGPPSLPFNTREPHEGSMPFARHQCVIVVFWKMNPARTACSTFGSGEEAGRMEQPVQWYERDPSVSRANLLSTSFAELLPHDEDDVPRFLTEAATALGELQADLARRLGVSHATLSSWKRRGGIPEPHLTWFTTEFVPQIFRVDPQSPREGFAHRGLEVAMAVFRQTDFDVYRNCYGEGLRQVQISFRNVSPISRLGLFVLNRLQRGADELVDDHLWNRVVPKVIELARIGTRSAW